jgi:UDP-glucuronate decarboxylase
MNTIVNTDLDVISGDIQIEKFNHSTIVLTGCAGFLGFYFVHFFAHVLRNSVNTRIICLDKFVLNKPEWLDELVNAYPKQITLSEFDVAKDDISEIDGALEAEYIVHMASIASPSFYRKFPIETMDANVLGLRMLLEKYRESKHLRGFLFFSSSEVYGDPNPENIPTRESYRGSVSPIGPRACYDEAKRFGETMCYVFSKHEHVPITVCRPFNNYGPGMSLDDKRLPADFAKSVLSNKDIEIFSDGKPTRTFCYISDAITGYLKALLYGKFEVFNIGIEKPEISVAEFANMFATAGRELLDYTGEIIYTKHDDGDYLTDNPNRRCPDISKARQVLGYKPRVGVEEGVRRYLQFLSLNRIIE